MTSVNIKYVIHLLGLLMLLMSASMSVALGWALYEYWFEVSLWRQGSEVVRAFVYSMTTGLLAGVALFFVGYKTKSTLGRREALLLVGLAWFVGAAVAALPFWFWAQIHSFTDGQDLGFYSYVNAYFESMSGLTTTGATILKDIETIPRGLLFWRAFTHWLGGLGIVVIFVAVLPSLGGGSKRLFSVESSGISNQGVTPNIRDTARILLSVYLGFTLAQTLILRLVDSNLGWFGALTHSFATLATGGYSTFNAGGGALNPAAQWVVVLFMVLAGVNFALYHQLWRGKFDSVIENSELRFYLFILLVAFSAIFFSILDTSYPSTTGELTHASFEQAARDAAFQVASVQTTTGFASADFEQWPLLPQGILLILMFVGGCGGSTAGGIKVVRILGALKIMLLEIERAFRPSVLRPVRIGTHNVEYHQRISVLAYVLGIFVICAIGTLLLFITENHKGIDGATAVTAAIATVNNIGPGFGAIGPIDNYGWFSSLGKLVMCVLMAIGRLEVFAVIVAFMPGFWKSN